MIVRMARRLVQKFQENGVTKDKVVVSIPATEHGVHATRLLAEDEILVNLTMVAGMSHAAVCAEAGAAWITFHLDRVSFHTESCVCGIFQAYPS
jgi:transaldolase